MSENQVELQARILRQFGADQDNLTLLLDYVSNPMSASALPASLTLPLQDEPFAPVWKEYAQEAEQSGFLQTLQQRLIQLNFPVQAGMSQDPEYQEAVKKGQFPQEPGTGPAFVAPEQLNLFVHESPAGCIGVLLAKARQDFVTLVQALLHKNEPAPVPDSLGAFMVSGYNNWDRIRSYKQQWMANQGSSGDDFSWMLEFEQLKKKKELYQDKFMILSSGPYSGVQAERLGLGQEAWLQTSLRLRLEHECTHYFTRRVFASMQKNLWDELLADYMGILAAQGAYNAKWFLLFLGLEDYPAYRSGGRFEKYLPESLPDSAFRVLQEMTLSAARNLQSLDNEFGPQLRSPWGRSVMLLSLCLTGLATLASSGYRASFLQAQSAIFERLNGVDQV
jgi:hypothetical protein